MPGPDPAGPRALADAFDARAAEAGLRLSADEREGALEVARFLARAVRLLRQGSEPS